MSIQIVPIHRTNNGSIINTNGTKNDYSFDPFNYTSGQDQNIRWLSRPNQQLVREKYAQNAEKFRITFDAENFQPDQIKIYIQNRKLTITGVYEERSEGRFMQKQFERTFDIPTNADVDAIASFITPGHMLVVEIPLNPSAQMDSLNISNNLNDQRRLSFSLNKFNTTNNQGLLSPSNDLSGFQAPGQQIRRTSITKTTTTTTTGSSALPPEAVELLKNAETSTGTSTHTYSTQTTERSSSNTGNQQININEQPNTSSSSTTTSNKQTILTSSDLGNLPIEIPPELLSSGGKITIQKRKVSITKGTDGSIDQGISVPITGSNETQSTSSTTTTTTQFTDEGIPVPIARGNNTQSTSSTTTTNTTRQTDEAIAVPIKRVNDTQSTSSTITNTTNTTNNISSNLLSQPQQQQQQTNTSERRGSKTISTSNQSRMYTLEEFLQNKTWNPSLIDGPDGKKILYMRLQMKPGTTLDQMKISLNGYDLRVEVDNKVSTDTGRYMSEHSYRQVTLFPTCDVDQLKTEFKDDGYLHIQVPIKL